MKEAKIVIEINKDAGAPFGSWRNMDIFVVDEDGNKSSLRGVTGIRMKEVNHENPIVQVEFDAYIERMEIQALLKDLQTHNIRGEKTDEAPSE